MFRDYGHSHGCGYLGVAAAILCALPQSSFGLTPKELFQNLSPAVVKVEAGGKSPGRGAGFFVSGDGYLLTNYHVVKSEVHQKWPVLSIETQDGQVVTDIKVAQCDFRREIDLCLLKANIAPKAWFEAVNLTPATGDKIFTIGHPRGLSYSLMDGMVSGTRKFKEPGGKQEVEYLQMSILLSPGNSGGPVFDEEGRLVGVATGSLQGASALNFAVPATEIQRFQREYGTGASMAYIPKPTPKLQAPSSSGSVSSASLDKIHADLDSTSMRLTQGMGPDPQKFRSNLVSLEKKLYTVYLPKSIPVSQCAGAAMTDDALNVVCVEEGGVAAFRLYFQTTQYLNSLRSIANEGQTRGPASIWDALTGRPAQQLERYGLTSDEEMRAIDVGGWKCGDTPLAFECNYWTVSPSVPGAVSQTLTFQPDKSRHRMLFSVWTAQPELLGYYNALLHIMQQSLRAQDRPVKVKPAFY